MRRGLVRWFSVTVIAFTGGMPAARAESFHVSLPSNTTLSSNYEWTFHLTLPDGLVSSLEIARVAVPEMVTSLTKPGGWLPLSGAADTDAPWNYFGPNDSDPPIAGSGTAVVPDTVLVSLDDLDRNNLKFPIADPLSKTGKQPDGPGAASMPEPDLAFYVTLGLGLFAIAVFRISFTKSSRRSSLAKCDLA